MQTEHFCAMDELHRVLLPTKLCEQLGWGNGSKVTGSINQPDKTLNIKSSENGEMMIDNMSRIKLDKDVRDELGWKGDKLSISVSPDGLHLVLEQKNM